MSRLALWVAQATTSSTPTASGPGGGMRPGGPGGGPGGGMGGGREAMREGAEQFMRDAHDHGDHHWWMFALLVVAVVAFIGLAVWAIIAFSRAANARTAALTADGGPGAKELLDQRLAKGDISPEDYEARKKLLDG